jgi:hypothetical protein
MMAGVMNLVQMSRSLSCFLSMRQFPRSCLFGLRPASDPGAQPQPLRCRKCQHNVWQGQAKVGGQGNNRLGQITSNLVGAAGHIE